MLEDPRIAVATHYPEGAVLAISRSAVRRGRLRHFYTSLYTGRLLRSLRSFPWPAPAIRQQFERGLSRRAFPGIPSARVESVARIAEIGRIAAYRLPGEKRAGERANFAAKEQFDRSVAARLPRRGWDAIVGMVASAEQMLRVARTTGRLGVLNFVDSHPTYHNRYLTDLARVPADHHELVPERTARRVARELALADLVLVPSRFVAGQLHRAGVPDEKVAIEPYGVDLTLFHPPAAGRAGGDGRVLRCLYVGAISHRKGIPVLVEAARRLQHRPIEFDLVGFMKSPDVLDHAPPNVRWRGPSAHGGLSETMRAADLFVLPSIEDAYPLVTLEAMASGLPVVVSDHAGTSELVTDGEDGLVVPAGDGAALARAIDRLVASECLRTAIGAAARRQVAAGHSWDDYGNRVLDLIRERAARVRPE